MNIQRIEYFVTLANTLSFTQTAKIHFISQAAVTQQIHLLEDELGVKLFSRNNRQVEMTPAGRVYYEQAVKILDLLRLSKQQLRNMSEEKQQSATIGLVGISNALIIPILDKYYADHPSVELRFARGTYESIMHMISDHTCDLGISMAVVSNGIDQEKYSKIDLVHLPLYIVISNKSRFTQYRSLDFHQLDGEEIVFPAISRETMGIVNRFLLQHGCERIHLKSTDSFETAMLNVIFGKSLLMCTESVLGEIRANQRVAIIPISNLKLPLRAYWNEGNQNPVLKDLIELVRQYFNK